LAENEARIWLQTRLSVAHKLKALYKNLVSAPKIWMLTGIYLIEDAVTFSVTSKSSSGTLAGSDPLAECTGIAALLGVSRGAKVSLGEKLEALAGTQILGKRVWASQWKQVHARYALGSSSLLAATYNLRLLDIWGIGTQRGSGDGDIFAQVSMCDGQDPESWAAEEGKGEYSEDVWKVFMAEVDGLLDDLEE